MKKIDLYEIGEEVYVKAIVTGMTIDQGEIKYHLKNEITGRNYDHLFSGEQLYSLLQGESVKNTAPIMKEHHK